MERVAKVSAHLCAASGGTSTSPEELRRLRLQPNAVRELVQQRHDAGFDMGAMKRWLDHDNHAMRDDLRQFLADPLFEQKYHVTLEETRTLALQRLRKVAEQPGRFFSVRDFATNPQRIFAAHELTCMVDGSLATKLTVTANLFGGTVFKLGTERHHAGLLDRIDAIEQVGCFALTELGYGNNAIEMETTAEYDAARSEFVINSPSPLSCKYWITNGACDAHWAVVFAQTTVGGKAQGVMAYLVRIREDDLSVRPGVVIRDMGVKQGQVGVDNALLSFDHVRVPRTALLNRVADVNERGELVCDISSRRGRFLVALNQLLSGRLCLSSKAVGRTKQALAIAVRYSATRLCVGESGKSDTPILDYNLQQRALLPLIARAYCVSGLGMNFVKQRFSDETTAKAFGLGELSPETNLLCSAIKAFVTWHCERTASICRERCGGQGYLAANKFADILTDAHAVSTAEGDNRVLAQKCAKELLDWYKQGRRVLPRRGASFGAAGARPSLRNLDYLAHLMAQREAAVAADLQGAMDRDMKAGAPLFEVWMKRQSDNVQALARAFVERTCFDQMRVSIAGAAPGIQGMLEELLRLFAVDCFETDAGLMLTKRVLPIEQADELYATANALCTELGTQALHLVDAFAVPQHLLPPAARDWVAYNTVDNQGEISGMPM